MDKVRFVLIFCMLIGISIQAFSQKKEVNQPQTPAVTEPAKEVKQEPQKEEKKEELTTIKGTIKEIAKDKSYILVDDTKISTTKEFLDESYLEVGDKVEITAKKTDSGLVAVNYNYIFEEENLEEPSESSD